MQLGHSRGRPHKQVTPVDYSDFPHNASKKETRKVTKKEKHGEVEICKKDRS